MTDTTQQYVTGNIYLAAALLCLDAEYTLGEIIFDKNLQYNKAKFNIVYPEVKRKMILDSISDFDQKTLNVNLYRYNQVLRKIRESLSKYNEEEAK